MPHKFDPQMMERLDSEERRRLIDVEALLSYLPLEPHQSVADIGCGTGFFALPLSRRLSGGRVYALDISDEMLERLRQKVEESQTTNVEMVKCGEADFPLSQETVDGVLLAFVLHEQEDRITFLEKVRQLLKPGAWISVIEWEKRETTTGPPVAERIDQAELRRMAEQVGLEVAHQRSVNDTHYLVVLKRPDGPSEHEISSGATS